MSSTTDSDAAITSSTEAPSSTTALDTTSSIITSSSEISSTTVETSSSIESRTSDAASTSTFTLPSTTIPQTTNVITSIVTPTSPGQTPGTTTVVITRTNDVTSISSEPTTATSASTSAALNSAPTGSSSDGDSGLATGPKIAIAVVVPVVAIAALVLLGILFLRRRKSKKAAEEARRKEVEDYGFNPNNDPTLPTVVSESGHEMTEDSSGYRGWGAAAASNRKMSTTLSGGRTQGQLSDAGSNQYRGAGSPNGGNSDGHSADPMLHQRRETMNSDEIGSLGHGPVAGAGVPGVKRGPSNASSTYSAGAHSDLSGDGAPPLGAMSSSYEAYNPAAGYGYSQHGPYGDGTYGGGNQDGMPIVQDVSARRNTRIQQPGQYQQGNSGIAQNF